MQAVFAAVLRAQNGDGDALARVPAALLQRLASGPLHDSDALPASTLQRFLERAATPGADTDADCAGLLLVLATLNRQLAQLRTPACASAAAEALARAHAGCGELEKQLREPGGSSSTGGGGSGGGGGGSGGISGGGGSGGGGGGSGGGGGGAAFAAAMEVGLAHGNTIHQAALELAAALRAGAPAALAAVRRGALAVVLVVLLASKAGPGGEAGCMARRDAALAANGTVAALLAVRTSPAASAASRMATLALAFMAEGASNALGRLLASDPFSEVAAEARLTVAAAAAQFGAAPDAIAAVAVASGHLGLLLAENLEHVERFLRFMAPPHRTACAAAAAAALQPVVCALALHSRELAQLLTDQLHEELAASNTAASNTAASNTAASNTVTLATELAATLLFKASTCAHMGAALPPLLGALLRVAARRERDHSAVESMPRAHACIALANAVRSHAGAAALAAVPGGAAALVAAARSVTAAPPPGEFEPLSDISGRNLVINVAVAVNCMQKAGHSAFVSALAQLGLHKMLSGRRAWIAATMVVSDGDCDTLYRALVILSRACEQQEGGAAADTAHTAAAAAVGTVPAAAAEAAPAVALEAAPAAAASAAAEEVPAAAAAVDTAPAATAAAAAAAVGAAEAAQCAGASRASDQQRDQQAAAPGSRQKRRPRSGAASCAAACAHCGAAAAAGGGRLKKCSGCWAARFCSQGCSEAAWPGHKAFCKQRQAARAQTGDSGRQRDQDASVDAK